MTQEYLIRIARELYVNSGGERSHIGIDNETGKPIFTQEVDKAMWGYCIECVKKGKYTLEEALE